LDGGEVNLEVTIAEDLGWLQICHPVSTEPRVSSIAIGRPDVTSLWG